MWLTCLPVPHVHPHGLWREFDIENGMVKAVQFWRWAAQGAFDKVQHCGLTGLGEFRMETCGGVVCQAFLQGVLLLRNAKPFFGCISCRSSDIDKIV